MELAGCPQIHWSLSPSLRIIESILGGQTQDTKPMEELYVTDKKIQVYKAHWEWTPSPFPARKAAPTLFGAGRNGNIHESRPHPTLQPPREESHALPGARGSGDVSTPALLCSWIQPLEDGSVPGHAGNHQILFANRQHADPITSRAPEISTPTHSSPNHKLEVRSPQLCFASQTKAGPLEMGNWDFTGNQCCFDELPGVFPDFTSPLQFL